MDIIQINKLQYNDTPQARIFSSENFNWCLDKEMGIAATWGKQIKETPNYDPLGPQQIVWKIDTNFNLLDYIKYFNFLANIRYKKDNQILPVENTEDSLINQRNYICMSTLSNVVFIIDDITDNLEKFIEYIRNYNISIKIQFNINKNIDKDKLFKLSPFIILDIKSDFNSAKVIEIINNYKKDFNINVKLHINENSNIQLLKFIENVDSEICCIIYNEFPYLSTRKYLNFQARCLSLNKQNICLGQCSKKYYSKDVIGSLILEFPCSYCKYSIYIENNKVYNCEFMKNTVGNIDDFKTLDLMWNDLKILDIRKQLIDNNRCEGIK